MDIVLLHYHLTRGLNSKYGAHIIQRKRERERQYYGWRVKSEVPTTLKGMQVLFIYVPT